MTDILELTILFFCSLHICCFIFSISHGLLGTYFRTLILVIILSVSSVVCFLLVFLGIYYIKHTLLQSTIVVILPV